jgi:DNA-binding MurR/RpiR family transcriptional regulator
MTQSALARIESRYDTLSTALQKAARWATDHPADVCFLSLREQARRAGVVPPTMSRLAKALGFADFRAFQDNFRDCIAWGSGDFAVRAQRMQRRARSGAAKTPPLGQLQTSNVESLAVLNPAERFRRAAATLLKARTVGFLGFRSCHSVALHAHYLYSMLIGGGALLQDTYGTLTESVAVLAGDGAVVAIGLAPYSRQTVEATLRARAQGAAVIAITDSELSPLARASTERLLFEPASSSFFHSIVAAHALVERLMGEVAACGGRKVVARLQQRETLLRDAGAYWHAPSAGSGGLR